MCDSSENSSFLIQSEAEQTTAETASTTVASKPHSNSDVGMETSSRPHSDSNVQMETGNEEAEQDEPSDNHPLSNVVLCFSKKVTAQESKSLLSLSVSYDVYGGTLLNGHPSTADICIITDISKPLNSGHPTILYNVLILVPFEPAQ